MKAIISQRAHGKIKLSTTTTTFIKYHIRFKILYFLRPEVTIRCFEIKSSDDTSCQLIYIPLIHFTLLVELSFKLFCLNHVCETLTRDNCSSNFFAELNFAMA